MTSRRVTHDDTGVRHPILDVVDLSKTYPGQVALAHAHLQVERGEVHALVGQNGSGKSTLIKLLAGYVQADRGARVRVDGQPVDLWRLDPHVRDTIRIVHQDLGLVPSMSTVENLGFGRGYATGAAGRILWRREVARAQQLLLRFGLAPDVRQPVGTLTAAERAAVAIVRALQDWDERASGLLVLDEPTASLNRREVDALFGEVRRVAELGAGVLFVSHVLDEVLDLADRVTVLRDGRVVAAGVSVRELDQEQLVHLIVGREVEALPVRRSRRRGRPMLEAHQVFGVTARGVSLRAHEGEILGIAGLVGSGREEIAATLAGAAPRFAGKVLVDKCKVFASPRDALQAGIALVPAERKTAGLDPQDRLYQHIVLPRLGPLQGRVLLRYPAMRREAAEWARRLDVRPPLLDRRMEKFSGGNQQKAVLARWLRTEPRVLVLDEPTQGVDVGAKAAIYEHIGRCADAGMAVVVASSDADELVRLCDRVVVMRSGAVAVELADDSLTVDRVIAETVGATSMRKRVSVHREPITFTVITDDDAAAEADRPTGLLADRRDDHPTPPKGRFATFVAAVRRRVRPTRSPR